MIEQVATAVLVVNVIAIFALWSRQQNILYAIFSLSLLVLLGATVAKEFTPEWRDYQLDFLKMQMEKESNPEIIATLKSAPIKIKQIWNKELDIADRCITCHQAVNNPNYKNAPEPFRYHAKAREHDFAKIGCTICHAGQGRATEAKFAHAQDIGHWDNPMWENDMVQVSCPQCHEQLYKKGYTLKGAERIIEARNIIAGNNEMDMECRACHNIRGTGEVLAPELTEFGARTEHEFELTHNMNEVEGEKNMYQWTYQHFLDPEKITPGDEATGLEPTIMPNFELTKDQAHNLVVFVFGLKTSLIPSKYQYKGKKVGKTEPTFIKEYEKSIGDINSLPVGQQLFVKSQCWMCHTIGEHGGKIGPNFTHIGSKRDKAFMVDHFKTVDSKKGHPMAGRFHFTDSEIEALVDYLVTLK